MKRLHLILATVVVTWCASTAVSEAGLFNKMMRKLGLGWSDGYHSRTNGHWQHSSHGYHVPYATHGWEPSRIVPSPHVVPAGPQTRGNWQLVPGTTRTIPSPSVPTPALRGAESR